MQVLQAHTSLVASPHLSEELSRLHAALTMEPKLKTEGLDSLVSTLDIEAESNSYFQKLFNGEITIDAIIQTLTRFKESSIERYAGIPAQCL